ncbi:hypothetical protein PMIN06_010229 [Paraphaeosphaeria minitans]|uniref:MADS-box domain-containing protein n=1 Tax=Paraphaeosphaeria minitans TaxID=565426 RepID=A0A9P6GDJ5_9PLEO|nr:hypothetical protein PMIN01_08044 [Paraphaeosphaeria minitans]
MSATSAAAKMQQFFKRRSDGINVKAKAMVLQNQDVKVAIFYSHGDEFSVFRSHPHLPNWPFPQHLLGSTPIHETSMENYPTKPQHMMWMAEWLRREGLSMPWSQSAQPVVPEASGAFEGNATEDAANEHLAIEESKGLLERTAAAYDQEPALSEFDIIGPEWFGIQHGQSPKAAPPPSRQTPTAPVSEVPVESDDDLTDDDFINLGSENRHRGGGSDPSSISPLKRPRHNDGHYIRSAGPAPMNRPPFVPLNRKIKNAPRRARSAYNLHPQGGIQLHDNHGDPFYRTATEIYGSPPLTRTRAARANLGR